LRRREIASDNSDKKGFKLRCIRRTSCIDDIGLTIACRLGCVDGRLGYETSALDNGAELISEADREIGTMAHEWNFNDDGSVCQLYARFVDADAAMLHLGMFGEKFADRFLKACSVTGVTILGYANDDVRGALAKFSPNVLTQKAGFARFAD